MSGKHYKINNWNIFRIILLIIFIGTFVICSGILIYWLKSNNNLEQIEKVLLSDSDIEDKVIKLITKANNRGGTDNISVAYLIRDMEGEV